MNIDDKKICIFEDKLCFNVSNDLEKYRIESALDKEPETIAWINGWKLKNSGAVFFDIGANIGIFSLYAGFKHPNLKVFSFEPTSNNYISLQRNVWLNKYNNIHPFNLAMSKSNKITNLYFSDVRVGNSGAQIDRAVNENGEEFEALRVESVLSISLDQLIIDYNFPVPSYVKIDVDGHEIDILGGMTKTLAEPSLESILVEFNNDGEFFEWSQRLENLGFSRDFTYEKLPNHSRIRRQAGGGSARNYIFNRY